MIGLRYDRFMAFHLARFWSGKLTTVPAVSVESV